MIITKTWDGASRASLLNVYSIIGEDFVMIIPVKLPLNLIWKSNESSGNKTKLSKQGCCWRGDNTSHENKLTSTTSTVYLMTNTPTDNNTQILNVK